MKNYELDKMQQFLKTYNEIINSTLKPYYDSQKIVTEGMSAMYSATEALKTLQEALSLNIKTQDILKINALAKTMQETFCGVSSTFSTLDSSLDTSENEVKNKEKYISKELTNEVNELLESVQENIPSIEKTKKTTKSRLTYKEVMEIIIFIVTIISFVKGFVINETPVIENNYYIDVEKVDSDYNQLENIITKIDKEINTNKK